MIRYYVGIDPSISNTGITILGPDGQSKMHSDASCAYLNKYKMKHEILRYQEITHWITNLITAQDYINEAIIGYENYSFQSVNKAFSLGEFGGVLKTALMLCPFKTTLYLIPPKIVKMFANGHGGSSKELLLQQYIKDSVENQNDAVKLSDDIIDSFYLANLAAALEGVDILKDSTLYRFRLEVLRDIKKKGKVVKITNEIAL